MSTDITALKFGRNYELHVQQSSAPLPQTIGPQPITYIVIEPPFTLVFEITKDCLASSSSGTFQVYNLSSFHKNQIRKNINDFLDVRRIVLKAGYGNNLPVIFDGMIQRAFSMRTGVDDITQIEAADWSFAFVSPDSDFYGAPIAAQSTQKDLLRSVIRTALPNVKLGAIGAGYRNKFKRNTSHSDMGKDIMQVYTGGHGTSGFFVDNGVANVLGQNEALPAQGLETINAGSGLLNKPMQEANILSFDMLFEPRLIMGQIVNLESVTEPGLSGAYKVMSIKHRCTISDAVSGDAITSVGLFSPHFPPWPNQFRIVQPETP